MSTPASTGGVVEPLLRIAASVAGDGSTPSSCAAARRVSLDASALVCDLDAGKVTAGGGEVHAPRAAELAHISLVVG